MALSSSDAANFAMAVKQAQPGISDADLAALVKEAGDVNEDPAKSAALAAKIAPQAAAQAGVNTQLASPYQGAGYSKADLMSQFSPEQLKNAYADQQQMYQSTLPSRAIGGVLAGGSGSGDVMLNNRNQWEGIDKQNMLQSIDKQKALQLQATEGLAAGTVAQNQDKTAGEYQLSQAKGAQDLAQGVQKTTQGSYALASEQRLNDPNSNESLTAKAFLKDQIEAGGMSMPQGINASTLTARQILNMGILEPKALEALKTKVGVQSTQATTGKTLAGIPEEVAKGKVATATANALIAPTNPPTPGGPTFSVSGDPAAFRAGLVGKVPQSVIDEFDRQYPAQGPQLSEEGKSRLKLGTINAAGVSLPPNPADVAKAEGAGKQVVDFNQRVRTYKTTAEPQIDAALAKLGSTSAGKGTDLISRWMPGNEQQELVNLLAQVNNTYPSAMPSSVADRITSAQKAGGYTGSMVASMTNDQLRSALKMIKANVLRDIAYQQEQDKYETQKGQGSFGSTQTSSAGPLPQRNAKGWELHTDKDGNKAYVAPNGKDYEEVK